MTRSISVKRTLAIWAIVLSFLVLELLYAAFSSRGALLGLAMIALSTFAECKLGIYAPLVRDLSQFARRRKDH